MSRPITSRRWIVISDLINANGYKRIAEVGVCRGQTAIPVSQACDLEKYSLIDPMFHASFVEHIKANPEPCFELIWMDSLYAVDLFADQSLDLVFIDPLHDETNVTQDCAIWRPKVRPGGVLCGHDYDNRRFPGVKIAVDREFGEENIETVLVKACKVWIYHVPEE